MTWIFLNWRWLAPIAGAIALFFAGWHFGSQHVQAKWDASAARQRMLTEEAIDRDRKAAEERSNALEIQLAKLRQSNAKLTRRLNDEIPSNTVYSTCVVPPRGVSIINGFRSGTY